MKRRQPEAPELTDEDLWRRASWALSILRFVHGAEVNRWRILTDLDSADNRGAQAEETARRLCAEYGVEYPVVNPPQVVEPSHIHQGTSERSPD